MTLCIHCERHEFRWLRNIKGRPAGGAVGEADWGWSARK